MFQGDFLDSVLLTVAVTHANAWAVIRVELKWIIEQWG